MSPAKTIALAILLGSAVLPTGPSFAVAQDVEPTPAEMKLIRAAEAKRIASIKNVYGTVVSVLGPNGKGTGSGVVFDSHGFALTNHHVVAAVGKKGKAGLADGKVYNWDLVGTDPAGDIAIIQLRGRDTFQAARIADSTKVRQGDWTMAMGNPFGLAQDHTPTVTLGIVSGVHRYQGGGMVYGNCIQVDSAINPGNSGGPLMNMRGEVIGINGRAAFAERGRVNVGVGFAVSAEQVKNFIPDLLATKVAQHGTLDAQFAMREGKVICEAINLDSRAARAGLKLGDRLVSVNGEPIETSNELANVIAMLPTDWPVHVVYEHEGQEFDFSVRLSPLTIAPRPQPPPVAPEGPDPSEDEKAPEKEGPQKDKKPGKRPVQGRRPKLPPMPPGSFLSMKVNRANARRIFEQWQSGIDTAAVGEDVIALQWSDKVGREAGESTAKCTITSDGRFLLKDDQRMVYRTPKGLFERRGDAEPTSLMINEALSQPDVLAVAMQAARYNASILNDLGEPTLDGGDVVNGQLAFRLRFEEKTTDPFFVWFSLASPRTLLKAGFDKDGTISRPAVVFNESAETKAFQWSRQRRFITGVRGEIKTEWTASDEKIVDVPEELRSADDSE